MTDGLTNPQIKVLTWIMQTLLILMVGVVSWLCVQMYTMPDKYVRLERYQSDQDTSKDTLSDIKSDTRDIRQLLDKIYVRGD